MSNSNHITSKFLAEFIGTLAFVFLGCSAIVAFASDALAVCLAHGFAIALLVAMAAPVSGGHINPAVTLGFFVRGDICIKTAVTYWIAQFAGAAAGAWLVSLLVTADFSGLTHKLAGSISVAQGLGLEALATFLFLTVIFNVTRKDGSGQVAPLFVGLTIATLALAVGGLTGGSFNPARSFGPAVLGGFDGFWVYLAGPFAGAILAALVSKYCFCCGTCSDASCKK